MKSAMDLAIVLAACLNPNDITFTLWVMYVTYRAKKKVNASDKNFRKRSA